MNLPEDPDTIDLQQYGYRQQLQRSLGNFSSFAVAFSLISVFTGIFANFGHGLRCVGGGIVGSWLVVLAGQLLVALVLAELSQRMPLSGYGYQWSTRLTNPHVGFWVGWLLLMQFLTGFPGVCATLSAHLGDCLGPRWSTPGGMQTLTLGVVVALTAPPTPLPGISTQHLPAWSTASALGVGAAVYWGAIRGRVRSGEAGPPR